MKLFLPIAYNFILGICMRQVIILCTRKHLTIILDVIEC